MKKISKYGHTLLMDDYFCLKDNENLKQSWYICICFIMTTNTVVISGSFKIVSEEGAIISRFLEAVTKTFIF